MKVAFVVQRCGAEVNGGAEALCLQIAHRMQPQWDVEILTTCALDYMRWDNHYPPGVDHSTGVPIRRFTVDQPRDVERFNQMSGALLEKRGTATLEQQEEWMRAQGPISSGLFSYLETAASEYDAFIFFGYLYATTYFGLPLVKDRAYLAALGHDEWPIYLSMWDTLFALPKGYVFQTPEEFAFLRDRFPRLGLDGPVAGVGIDRPDGLAPEEFREAYGLADPFILYVGRVDASKGCDEMFEWWQNRPAHSARHKLVVTGREVLPVPVREDIVYLGFVSEAEKWNAMAACDWMLLPSKYESLSISLLETWSTGRPAIVNAESEVLRGHCVRGHGGLWYANWDRCDAILSMVDDRTKETLGRQGREYVETRYSWDRVRADYQRLLGGGADGAN